LSILIKRNSYKFARFKGVEDAKLAVLAGNADLTSGALTGINTKQLKAGDMTLLWIYSTKRDAEFPNAPTHFNWECLKSGPIMPSLA
jgi:tripartite-type tricarboxylate transporter receptor subunit TctC